MAAHPLPALPPKSYSDHRRLDDLWLEDLFFSKDDRTNEQTNTSQGARNNSEITDLLAGTRELHTQGLFHLEPEHLESCRHKLRQVNNRQALPLPPTSLDPTDDTASGQPSQVTRDQAANTSIDRSFKEEYRVTNDGIHSNHFRHSRHVRFADTYTLICTPSANVPPPPPPHLTPPYTVYAPTPHGPRIPPWVSAENLDRERRVRTDLRVLEDTLGAKFFEDECRLAIERQAEEEETRAGRRKTEVDEFREAVMEVYPELGFREVDAREKTDSCGCCTVI